MKVSPSFSVSCGATMRLIVAAVLVLAATVSAQERTLPVPPNVFVDGVPPIPAAISEGIAPYTQFRRARILAWHPIERRLIISTRFGDVPQLHDVRFPGGARRQLTFFRDGVTDRPAVVFDPAGRSFTFVKDVASGGEANQLFRYDLATNAITRLTEGRSKNESPVVSRAWPRGLCHDPQELEGLRHSRDQSGGSRHRSSAAPGHRDLVSDRLVA